MEKKSNFLTFLTALIPGLGYMYLGLTRKGIQALVIFILIRPVFSILSLSFLTGIVQVVLWCYTFFDTFNTANKLERGIPVPDTDFIRINGITSSSDDNNGGAFSLSNKKTAVIVGWVIVIIGVLALLNKMFYYSNIFYMIKFYLRGYMAPILLILAGVYLLYRNKR